MNYYASLSRKSGSGSSGSGSGKTTHSEMYANVLKRAEKQVDAGKKTDMEIAEYVLGQNITAEEAYDILTYLGLSGVLDQMKKTPEIRKSGYGAGGGAAMKLYD